MGEEGVAETHERRYGKHTDTDTDTKTKKYVASKTDKRHAPGRGAAGRARYMGVYIVRTIQRRAQVWGWSRAGACVVAPAEWWWCGCNGGGWW